MKSLVKPVYIVYFTTISMCSTFYLSDYKPSATHNFLGSKVNETWLNPHSCNYSIETTPSSATPKQSFALDQPSVESTYERRSIIHAARTGKKILHQQVEGQQRVGISAPQLDYHSRPSGVGTCYWPCPATTSLPRGRKRKREFDT